MPQVVNPELRADLAVAQAGRNTARRQFDSLRAWPPRVVKTRSSGYLAAVATERSQ